MADDKTRAKQLIDRVATSPQKFESRVAEMNYYKKLFPIYLEPAINDTFTKIFNILTPIFSSMNCRKNNLIFRKINILKFLSMYFFKTYSN